MTTRTLYSIATLLAVVSSTFAACSTPTTGQQNNADAGPLPTVDAGREAAPPPPPPCDVKAPTECPDAGGPTYADVAPIFERRCVTTCHIGAPGGPWSLASYETVADWQIDVRAEVLNCTMPPLDAGVPITTDERLAILTWLRCGLPR